MAARRRSAGTSSLISNSGELQSLGTRDLLTILGRHTISYLNTLIGGHCRYSGYFAWRGVFDFTGKESSDIVTGIRRAYPELGSCLYFDLAYKTHAVLYELPGNRLNWLWYINGPEPELTVINGDDPCDLAKLLIGTQ